MKSVFSTCVMIALTAILNAQNDSINTVLIEKSILNYIENFFENNFEEMNKSLHPRLSKRGLNPDGTLSDDFPPERLKEFLKTNPRFEVKRQYNVVEHITILGNMASATLKTGYPKTRWVEYIHLIKLNNEWKNINILWDFEKKVDNETITNDLSALIADAHLHFVETAIIKEDIHSFVVSQNSQIISENYYNGLTRDSLNNVKSVTKSIVGLLIGIAIDKGFIKDVNQPIIQYFSDCHDTSGFSSKKEITIEHLLMMQSGIQWDNRALVKDEWWFHEEPNCFFLNHFPMDTSSYPGKDFSYNSAAAHLLSGIVSRASGLTTKQFADKYLFEPLGILNYTWGMDISGEYRGNSELYLLPSDMVKIGNLLLNKGICQDKSIISSYWIDQMLEKAYDATSVMNFGYLWMTSKNNSPFFFFAGGSGGQHIFIVPDYQLVIVTTGHWNNARSTLEIMNACIERVIKPLQN